ncbi:Aspartic proteinase-like protein 1 [Acorus calamus]|uniref:Aspartic proteinase-like protein 1 n=1 Tax=Acorus calamus TaxID=4465 RepID=A0AAV9DU40_ACOCL|nr:Aspartic proteinase-like protein 1 [Acorus calamus]
MVTLGMPNSTFLVALDTGSDLFWVPCDCQQCAPTLFNGDGYRKCSGAAAVCPYEVAYVSTDTSSSGVLVEDVLHLMTEDTHPEVVDVRIIFGCGQVQTGSFLDAAAPNGLFGLGMSKMSVPSILASAGIISDSFSMCFGKDGVGRISFGDKGSSDQGETPFNVNQLQ